LDKWTEILDKGGCVDTIYCDFMKAFDKVPQLEKYQITGQFSGWIISCFSAIREALQNICVMHTLQYVHVLTF
jgi:hypothetical protein